MEKSVYLFYGLDTFIIKSRINNIIKKYDVDEFNVSNYDMDEVNLEEAINDASTIPFMTDLKIVIIRNAFFLSTEKPKKAIDHNTDALKRYLDRPNDSTILILHAPYQKLDVRKAITKELKEKAEILECKPLKEQDTSSWIKRQLAKNNLDIEVDALREFLKRVENNSEVLVNETQKLVNYAEGMNVVDLKMIQKVITKNVEDNVYEITNKILENNSAKALEIYNELVVHNADPLSILGILVNKYREILHVKHLVKQGKDQSQIAKYYNASNGRAYYMMKNASSVNLNTVEKHLKRLEEIDYQIKTGQIDKRVGIELFILST